MLDLYKDALIQYNELDAMFSQLVAEARAKGNRTREWIVCSLIQLVHCLVHQSVSCGGGWLADWLIICVCWLDGCCGLLYSRSIVWMFYYRISVAVSLLQSQPTRFTVSIRPNLFGNKHAHTWAVQKQLLLFSCYLDNDLYGESPGLLEKVLLLPP